MRTRAYGFGALAAMAGRMGPPRIRAAARAAERGLVNGDANSDAWSRLAERVDLHKAGDLDDRRVILAGAAMNAWAEPTARSNTQIMKQTFILHHTDFRLSMLEKLSLFLCSQSICSNQLSEKETTDVENSGGTPCETASAR